MLKTHVEAVHVLAKLVCDIYDALHEDLLDVMVEVAVEDGVGAGRG